MSTEKVVYELSLRDLMTKGLNDINSKLDKFEKNISEAEKKGKGMSLNLGSAFRTLAAGFATLGIMNKAKEIVVTTAKFQSLHNAIKFASDGSIQGAASIDWLSRTSKEMGLEITGLTEGFKTFQGAMINTKFSSSEVRTMFKQVSTGVVAMGLSTEDAKGTFLALGQIMGKGKVQAEELRGQIGERVPGAFSIAARAMGVTTSELDKLMKDGKLLSDEFLPKFAAEMEKTFGQGAINNANSLTSSINRMSNGWTELMTAMGGSQDSLGGIFNWLGDKLDSFADRFRTVEQIAKRESNEKLTKRLEFVDKLSKLQGEELQKKGLKGTALSDAMQRLAEERIASEMPTLKAAEERLNSFTSRILTAEGITGKMTPSEADAKMRDLMLTKEQSIFYDPTNVSNETYENWKKQRSQVQFLRDALTGTRQVYDKRADALGIQNVGGAEAEKLKKQASELTSGTPKVVNINVEALIKKVDNYFTGDRQTMEKEMEYFLDKLQKALNTLLVDTAIIGGTN